MRITKCRTGFLHAAALCLLFLSVPAASAGTTHFAPVQSGPVAKKAKSKRLRKVTGAPVLRQVLHPVATVRGAAGAAKATFARATGKARIARLDKKIGAAPAGAPSTPELERALLRQNRWRHQPALHQEARALLGERFLVLGKSDLTTAISAADLKKSATELEESVSRPETLLPVGLGAVELRTLVATALEASAGKQVYGAPEGVADLLESDLVAFSVVDRTLAGARAGDKGATAWLTANQREVLADVIDNDAAARDLLGRSYRDTVHIALSAAGTYRTEALRNNGELPLSIQAAIGKHPELAARIRSLEQSGARLRVRTMIKTPPGVRSAALEYGAIGEETEFSPFVEQVEKGVRPDPRPTRMGLVRAVASGRFSSRRLPTAIDLEKRIDLVERAVGEVLVIEADGVVDAALLEQVNRDLEPVRRLMAVHRIVFDVKHEAGEGARKLLPGVAGLAAAATGLQGAGAGEWAILLAEGGEDILQGAVEGASQDGQLRTRSEVWRPGTKIAAASALALSAGMARPIHQFAEHGMGYIAGPMMGVGSMSLSGTVFGNAVLLNRKGRLARLREGKVANKVPNLMFDAGFQRQLRRIKRSKVGSGRAVRTSVLVAARRTLTDLVASQKISRVEMDRTMSALEATGEWNDVLSMVEAPTRRSLWRAAWSEALGTPTRKALGQGMVITIVASSVVGTMGLLSGPAWGMAIAVLASAGEGLWGLYRSYRFERENRKSEEKELRSMAAGV